MCIIYLFFFLDKLYSILLSFIKVLILNYVFLMETITSFTFIGNARVVRSRRDTITIMR